MQKTTLAQHLEYGLITEQNHETGTVLSKGRKAPGSQIQFDMDGLSASTVLD